MTVVETGIFTLLSTLLTYNLIFYTKNLVRSWPISLGSHLAVRSCTPYLLVGWRDPLTEALTLIFYCASSFPNVQSLIRDEIVYYSTVLFTYFSNCTLFLLLFLLLHTHSNADHPPPPHIRHFVAPSHIVGLYKSNVFVSLLFPFQNKNLQMYSSGIVFLLTLLICSSMDATAALVRMRRYDVRAECHNECAKECERHPGFEDQCWPHCMKYCLDYAAQKGIGD